MVKEREMVTVEIEPESELAKALAAAGNKPITLLSNGRRYVVSRDPFDPVSDYDPEAFRAALRAVVGTLTPEEGERLKRDIFRWREEGTRSSHGNLWPHSVRITSRRAPHSRF